MFAGPIYDYNNDGLADNLSINKFVHFFIYY